LGHPAVLTVFAANISPWNLLHCCLAAFAWIFPKPLPPVFPAASPMGMRLRRETLLAALNARPSLWHNKAAGRLSQHGKSKEAQNPPLLMAGQSAHMKPWERQAFPSFHFFLDSGQNEKIFPAHARAKAHPPKKTAL
jgi:hypothetical protein